ncbi:hypothetical protein ACHAWC_004556 [Mediolabrus comicus]
MPRVPRSRRDGEEKCTAAVQTNGKIDFAQISNILEGAVDVLGNDKSKLATLENLLKTALEKVAQKKKTFLPPPKNRSRQNSEKRSSPTPPLAVPKTLNPPLTKKDLLSVGLLHAGFDHSRQNKVKDATNIDRFKAFYGLEPTTLVPVFTKVKDKFPDATFHHLLITMNWLTLYDTYLVLSGRWGLHHDTIGKLVWQYARMIQSFLNDKVGLHHVDMGTAIPLTLDTVTFTVNEIRTDPNSRWYDHKSHSSGFKYELSLSTTKPQIAWTNGPFPGSKHDLTVFHGGTEEEGEGNWDKDSLYFQIPEGCMVIADSIYKGEQAKAMTTTDEMSKEMKKYIGRAKARQETLNGRLKGTFNILGQRFRHNQKTPEMTMNVHQTVVHACLVLIQFDYENGHPPFPLH